MFFLKMEIIKKTIKEMRLPVSISYCLVKLGAKIFGKFNLHETSPIKAVKNAKIPIIYFHGEEDDFVPCQMSIDNFNATSSNKKIITIKGAGHGMCYLIKPDNYLIEVADFFSNAGVPTSVLK